MFGFKERKLAREARVLERRHQAWLEREKRWWNFMLTMDLACDKISPREAHAWRERIANGEEYIGSALRSKP